MRNAQPAPQAAPRGDSRVYLLHMARVSLVKAGRLAELSQGAQNLLRTLIDFADPDGSSGISRDYLQDLTGLKDTAMRTATQELEKANLLDVSREGRRITGWRVRFDAKAEGTITRFDRNRGNRTASADESAAGAVASAPYADCSIPMVSPDLLTQQQPPCAHEPEPAHEASGGAAAADEATPDDEEAPPAPSAPAASKSESIDGAEPIAQLSQGLKERLRLARVAPAVAEGYPEDLVTWALERLEGETKRVGVRNPGGFMRLLLREHAGEPVPASPQLQLPLAAAAAAENAEQHGPQKSTRWARSRDGGPALEVLEANPVRVQLAGGVAVPAWAWQRWEWFNEKPVDLVEHQVDEELPPAVPVDQKRQQDLARINQLAKIKPGGIHHPLIAERLADVGLVLEDLEAYRALQHLQGGTP